MPKIKDWSDFGITIGKADKGSFKILCPLCSHKRTKNPDEPCLSIDTELYGGCFHCHNCHWKGRLDASTYGAKEEFRWAEQNYTKPTKYDFDKNKLNAKTIKFFEKRGISKDTLEANMIGSAEVTFDRGKTYSASISYPFFKNDELVNVQYRSIEDKQFMMIKGAEKPFYGLQHVVDDGVISTDRIIICEGMNDKLALYEAGFRFVLSVPNGSPFEEEGKPQSHPQLRFLDDPDFINVVKGVDEIIMFGDNDYQGKRLRDAIAQRIGQKKCRLVQYPEGAKDANEVLLKYGTDKLIDMVNGAFPFPSEGIVTVSDIEEKLLNLYDRGIERGRTTGIGTLDKIYSVKDGFITITTGVPSVGKTTAWNNISVNLAKQHGIHVSQFSPEARPTELHASRLAQIYIGKGFNRDAKDRMTKDELMEGIRWVNNHFSWISPPIDKYTYREIFRLFEEEILTKGTKLFIIDPYASLTNDSGKSEHDFIKEFLTYAIDFVNRTQTHLVIIAHPTKLEILKTGEWAVPTAYNISGSAHWFNKADFILSIWKSNKSNRKHQMPLEIHVQKAKYKEIASANEYALIEYNQETESYSAYYGSKREYIEGYGDRDKYDKSHDFDEAYRQSQETDDIEEEQEQSSIKKTKTKTLRLRKAK